MVSPSYVEIGEPQDDSIIQANFITRAFGLFQINSRLQSVSFGRVVVTPNYRKTLVLFGRDCRPVVTEDQDVDDWRHFELEE